MFEAERMAASSTTRRMAHRYGGAKPPELLAANETVCKQFITNDAEMVTAIRRLVG